MTTFGIFVPDQPDVHRLALHAFALGLEHRSLKYEIHPLAVGYRPCDVLVTFGVAKAATLRGRQIGQLIEQHRARQMVDAAPVGQHLVIERGFLHRDEYYMVGWGGLNGRANYFNQRCSRKRWEKLGIGVAPWRTTGQHIVLCGQVPWDASVQHTDHANWCRETAMKLSALTDRPIRFRPHPLQPTAIDMADCPVEFSTNATLAEDLVDAWAAVTYNSNAGVEATIAGIPAFASDIGAMGYSILNHDIEQINSPATPDRRQWLWNLAYTQWTCEEMARGLAIDHLWCMQMSPMRHRWKLLTGCYPKFDADRSCDKWSDFERRERSELCRAA